MTIQTIQKRLDTSTLPGRNTTSEEKWRCSHCGKLLGIVRDGRLHLRFARGHEYMVGFPATGVCRGCRTLNEASGPSDKTAASTQQAETC